MTGPEPRRVALDALLELSEGISGQVANVVIALFEPDAMLIGTQGRCIGIDEIAALVRAEVEQPDTMTWDWDEQSLVVDAAAGIVWFIVNGEAVVTPAASTDPPARMGMRLSGVLRQQADGAWRWAQFHGSTADG